MKPVYKGISLTTFTKNKSIALSDVDLIKQDIRNHIFTRRGERIKMGRFGSIIPDLVFEPMDETSIFAVRDDIERVMSYEPRVEVTDIQVIPFYDIGVLVVKVFGNFVDLNLHDVVDIFIDFK